MLRLLVVLPAALAASLVAGTSAIATTAHLNEQDRTFLVQAHQGNLAEIAAGRAAVKRADSQAVSDAGAMFVRDHTSLDDDVKRVAGELGV